VRRKSLVNVPCASMTKFARGSHLPLHYVHSATACIVKLSRTDADGLQSADIGTQLAGIERRPWAERGASGPLTRREFKPFLG
jgi:hypothetical protein